MALAIALGATMGVSQAANAAYKITSGIIDPSAGSDQGNIALSPGFSLSNVSAGRIELSGTTDSGTSFSFESFCVDIKDELTAGSYSVEALSALGLDSIKTNQLTALLSNVDDYISTSSWTSGTTAERSAAAQLAIWEIVNESSDGGYSLKSGDFTTSGFDSKTISDASSILSKVGNGTNGSWKIAADMSFALLASPNKQTQIVYGNPGTVPGVPEPASWGLMVVGFGGLGAALRRKRPAQHAID